MTHTHTPGPWTKSGCTVYAGQMAIAATYCEGNRFLHGVYHHETVPDSMETHGQGWDEAGANARLISSAPDLLEALSNLENDDGSIPSHAWRIVQAAIAKATGKGDA